MKFGLLGAAAISGLIVASATSALAGPTYTFSTSTGSNPSNLGTITLTQSGSNSVLIKVDLVNPTYGFINSGGPHTPFAFQLDVSGGLSVDWTVAGTTPANGVAPDGTFSLNTSGGSDDPFGDYNTAIDYTGGNGSSSGYFGDLVFTLTRSSGLSTDDFITNGTAYFAADISNGSNTGAQAWEVRTPPPTGVPEPLTLSLFGAGLAGAAVLRRRRKA